MTATRTVRWQDGDAETSIVRLEDVVAGHEIPGPAIVEHSATTFAIPPGRMARLDTHGIFHLEQTPVGSSASRPGPSGT